MQTDLTVTLRRPHPQQQAFIESPAKRKVVRGGRRGGKTVGLAILAVHQFLEGHRILYATPTGDQIDRFWYEVKLALDEPIEAGAFRKNETKHIIEWPGTESRIRAKTAWNADMLRGDYADELILDEWQLMNEETWEKVGAPMLLDNNGNVTFVYTPPSPHSRSVSKADDPRHAAKLYKRAAADKSGRWAAFHFTSHDNPYISREALDEISLDMTALSYRMEILAEDLDEVPGALWKLSTLDATRVTEHPDLFRIVVALDPHATSGQAGIIVAGVGMAGPARNEINFYTVDDVTLPSGSSVGQVCRATVAAYRKWDADLIVGEINNGGDWIESALRSVDDKINYKTIRATRGKYTRAEPIAAIFEKGRGHMVGYYPELEDELCSYVPGDASPNRLDAMVWAGTELMLDAPPSWDSIAGLGAVEEYESIWK